jgi:hypothetical protein
MTLIDKIVKHKYVRYATAALVVMYLAAPNAAYAASANICGATSKADSSCNLFLKNYINPIIMLLTALVGVIAVISIIVAGIQYASSADDPGAVTKAKQRIFNTILGLLAYIFLFAFLNYLVPGGIF